MKAMSRRKAPLKQPVLYKGPVKSRPVTNGSMQAKEEPQEPPSKKAKTSKVVYVEQKKKKLEVNYDPSTLPADYQLVQYGNKDVIEFLLERSRKKGMPVWTANNHGPTQQKSELVSDSSKLSSHVGRVGYYFHKDLVAKALKRFNVNLTKGKLHSRGDKGNKKVTKADHEKGLLELYPHMPDRDRQTVLRALTTKGTKIGKATGTMNVYKQIELAVIAHVRHSHTDYEKLIYMSGKVSARNAVESDISAKLAEWKGEDGQHIDENETELVEFEEDSSSDSETSADVMDEEDDGDYSPPPAEQPHTPQHGYAPPQNMSRSWSAHEDPVQSSPLRRDYGQPQFGGSAYDQYSFDYRLPPPQQYPQYNRYDRQSVPHAHASSHTQPPVYAEQLPPRVHLRPLPPSPVSNGHPRDYTADPYSPARHDHTRYAHQGPPPQHSHSYDLRPQQLGPSPPMLPHGVAPVPPPGWHNSPRVQFRPLSPVRDRWLESRPSLPDHSNIRFRPLSPDDVVHSTEQFSPLPDNRKRSRPNDWDEYAVSTRRY